MLSSGLHTLSRHCPDIALDFLPTRPQHLTGTSGRENGEFESKLDEFASQIGDSTLRMSALSI